MKVIGINGAARKGWNTDTLVQKALDGAASAGAEVEMVELYKLNFKGCYECFACKRKGNTCNGVCAIKDELRPLLEKIINADALVLGSPNFFGYPSGMVRSLTERLLYPSTSYETDENGNHVPSILGKVIPTGVIFCMNSDPEYYKTGGYAETLGATTANYRYVFGYAEQYNCYETLQFKDYSKMDASLFNAEERIKRHETVFPEDEQHCFEMGKRLVEKVFELNKQFIF